MLCQFQKKHGFFSFLVLFMHKIAVFYGATPKQQMHAMGKVNLVSHFMNGYNHNHNNDCDRRSLRRRLRSGIVCFVMITKEQMHWNGKGWSKENEREKREPRLKEEVKEGKREKKQSLLCSTTKPRLQQSRGSLPSSRRCQEKHCYR